jgi:hypothetical protein
MATPLTFCLTKLETALGVTLPRAACGTPLVKGTLRNTPYGMLFNVSVVQVGGDGRPRQWGPDDETYRQFPVLYSIVPRVHVVAVQEDGSYTVVAAGMAKFLSATSVDDDDGDDDGDGDGDENEGDGDGDGHDIKNVVVGTGVHVTAYYADEKANGHLVFFRLLPGTRLLLGGTKNCAWMAHLGEDVATVRTHAPTTMVGDALAFMLNMIATDSTGAVMQVLLTGKTLLAEQKTNQHIQFYKEPDVMFFDATLPPPFKTPHTLGPFLPHEMTDAHILKLRSGGNSEGWVLRGVDAVGSTVRLLKLKTASYVILRVGRELYNPEDGLAVTVAKWRLRMHMRNAFLKVDARYLDDVVFTGFMKPLAAFMYQNAVSRQDISYSGRGFAHVIQAFRDQTGASDDFELPAPCDDGGEYAAAALRDASSALQAAKREKVVHVSGGTLILTACMPPGVGKTTLTVKLATRLSAAGARYGVVTDMCQDQFSDAKTFYGALRQALVTKQTVCLHRCCFSVRDRQNVFAAARSTGSRVLAFMPTEYTTAMAYTALRGVVLRGADHESMGVLTDSKRCLVTAHFILRGQALDALTECRGIRTALAVPVSLLRHDTVVPASTAALLEAFMAIVRARAAFDTSDLTVTEDVLLHELLACIRTGPELRRDSDVVVSEMYDACSSFFEACMDVPGGIAAPWVTRRVLYVCLVIPTCERAALQHTAAEYGCVPKPGFVTTSDHVTVVYKPSAAQMASVAPFVGKEYVFTATCLRTSVDGDVCGYGIALEESATFGVAVPPDPHLTMFYDPTKHRAVETKTLFHDSKPSSCKAYTDISIPHITLSGVLTLVFAGV